MYNVLYQLVNNLGNFFTWYSQPGQLLSYFIACVFCCAVILFIIRGTRV